MTLNIQVVVDSADPHTQADWWAETLGWIVEPTDQDFVSEMIAKGFATEEETIIHNGVRVWKPGAAICPADEAGRRGRRRILFQIVPEAKSVKNRVHWDVDLGGTDKDDARAKLEARGATYLHDGRQGPHTWYTMADPEGNEFCIS